MKTTVILAALISISSNVLAKGSTHIFGISSSTKPSASKTNPRTDCPNFAGTYEMTCDGASPNQNLTVIEQLNCNLLKFNNDEIRVGSIESNTLADIYDVSSQLMVYNWNTTSPQLQVVGTYAVKFQSGTGVAIPMIGTLTETETGLVSSISIGEISATCNYIRK